MRVKIFFSCEERAKNQKALKLSLHFLRFGDWKTEHKGVKNVKLERFLTLAK